MVAKEGRVSSKKGNSESESDETASIDLRFKADELYFDIERSMSNDNNAFVIAGGELRPGH